MDTIRDKIAEIAAIGNYSESDILKRLHLRSDDILVLSGSLVEGTGTPTSDFDFCLIASEPDDRFDRAAFPKSDHMRFYTSGSRVNASFDYLTDSLLGVDCEYKTEDEIRSTIERHHTLYDYLRRRARKSSAFSSTGIDYRLLSRLTYGIALTNKERFEKLVQGISVPEIGYAAYRTSVGSFPDFRDITGLWLQNDYSTALVLTRKLANDHVRGLTHMYGNTNRNPKYLSRYLAYLPSELNAFVEEFRTLYVDDIRHSGSIEKAIYRWLELIDLIFEHIRDNRDKFEAFPTGSEFTELLRGELHAELEWHPEIDREYAFRAREALAGMPSLGSMLQDTRKSEIEYSSFPFKTWAASNLAVPNGENGNAFKA